LIMAEELLRGELEASASVDNRQTELVQLDSEPSGSAESCLQPMYCTQPWSVIYMSWNGDIRTCCFNDYALGNIDRNTIDEIWNGPRYRAMRKSVAEGKILEVCRDCVNGKSNYSVIPKLDPSLLFQEIRAILHQALT
jgi:MoaA/NifB/PqqE/SkfB family radical SAM enzyme